MQRYFRCRAVGLVGPAGYTSGQEEEGRIFIFNSGHGQTDDDDRHPG